MSNSVESVRSKIINIKKFLFQEITTEEFIQQMQYYLVKYFEAQASSLDDQIINYAKKLAYEKYQSWDWIIGNTPKFRIVEEFDSQWGHYTIDLVIKGGRISNIDIHLNQQPVKCDFF
jgi:lipoate-protein ligase A